MKDTIYQLAKECQQIKDKETNITYTKIQGLNNIYDDYTVTGCSDKFEDAIKRLNVAIQTKYPHIYKEINDSLCSFSNNRAACYIVICTMIDLVVNIENASSNNGKKIFISHSSKNADIVGWFVDHILQLGVGIDAKDIFCTSIEDMKIKNGEDIRKHIHDNIKSADFSYLFLSDEYKDSEICVNEMGAVWAYDSNVRYYTLPNFKFTEIGWLCDHNSAESLIDASTLDSIQRELRAFYCLEDRGETWSKQRKNFITQCMQLQ